MKKYLVKLGPKWRSLIAKALWTGVQGTTAVGVQQFFDLPVEWVPVIGLALSAVKSWVATLVGDRSTTKFDIPALALPAPRRVDIINEPPARYVPADLEDDAVPVPISATVPSNVGGASGGGDGVFPFPSTASGASHVEMTTPPPWLVTPPSPPVPIAPLAPDAPPDPPEEPTDGSTGGDVEPA